MNVGLILDTKLFLRYVSIENSTWYRVGNFFTNHAIWIGDTDGKKMLTSFTSYTMIKKFKIEIQDNV